jgi:hypothetical protein
MPPAEFEPASPAIQLSQSYALDRTTTGIGVIKFLQNKINYMLMSHLSMFIQTNSIDFVIVKDIIYQSHKNTLSQKDISSFECSITGRGG